jgi:prefoldin subunit 5
MDIIKLREKHAELNKIFEELDTLTSAQLDDIKQAEKLGDNFPESELDELYDAYELNLRKMDNCEQYMEVLAELIESINNTVNLLNELKELPTDFTPVESDITIGNTATAYDEYINLLVDERLGK